MATITSNIARTNGRDTRLNASKKHSVSQKQTNVRRRNAATVPLPCKKVAAMLPKPLRTCPIGCTYKRAGTQHCTPAPFIRQPFNQSMARSWPFNLFALQHFPPSRERRQDGSAVEIYLFVRRLSQSRRARSQNSDPVRQADGWHQR